MLTFLLSNWLLITASIITVIIFLNLALVAYLLTDYRKYLKHQKAQQNL